MIKLALIKPVLVLMLSPRRLHVYAAVHPSASTAPRVFLLTEGGQSREGIDLPPDGGLGIVHVLGAFSAVARRGGGPMGRPRRGPPPPPSGSGPPVVCCP